MTRRGTSATSSLTSSVGTSEGRRSRGTTPTGISTRDHSLIGREERSGLPTPPPQRRVSGVGKPPLNDEGKRSIFTLHQWGRCRRRNGVSLGWKEPPKHPHCPERPEQCSPVLSRPHSPLMTSSSMREWEVRA
jgi:hypothetical protein